MSCLNNQEDVSVSQKKTALLIDNQLLSINRLAEYLDVPVATIRDWVYKHKIPHIHAGRLIRFKFADVQRWLSERSHGNGHPKD